MDSIRVAMHGCGNIMNKHAGQSKDIPGVEIVGLCDVSEASMDRLIERSLGHLPTPPPKFADPAEMYAQTGPDAVVIASPHTLHFEHALMALEHGCHILMEKPMVTELGQAVDLEQRVTNAGRTFCIAYNTPCSAELYTLREYVRNQTFGKLKMVCVDLSQNWYRGTLGSWRQDPSLSGGGQLYDSGAHPLCSLIWTVESDVDEAYAHIDRLDSPVDINGTATVRFTNGVFAAIAIAGEGPNGTHGTWIFEQARIEMNPWMANFIEIKTLPTPGERGDRIKYPQMLGADGQPMSNFIAAIRGEDEPRTTPRNGVQHSQLMDALYRSAETGQPARPSVG